MHKLTQEQLSNLTDKLAWEVAGSFADFLEHQKPGFLEFDDVLGWDKGDILVCLLYLIRKNLDNKELVNVICTNIAILDTTFISTPENYQKQLDLKKLTDRVQNN